MKFQRIIFKARKKMKANKRKQKKNHNKNR